MHSHAQAASLPSGRPAAFDKAAVWLLLATLAICAAERVSLIRIAFTVAPDASQYSQFAKDLTADPVAAMKTNRLHPGYPAALAAVRTVLVKAGYPSDLAGWDLAGQLVSLVAGMAALAAIAAFTAQAYGLRFAWAAVLLFGVGRKWASLNADVLSDSLAVCLFLWAVVLAVAVKNRLIAGLRTPWIAAVACGLLAGPGYLVRVEVLLLVPLVVLSWSGGLFQAARRKATVACMVAMVLAAAAAAVPYMAVIGTVTHRHSIRFDRDAAAAQPIIYLASAGVELLLVAKMLLYRLADAMHVAPFVLACTGLVLLALRGVLRKAGVDSVNIIPRRAAGFWMLAWLVLFTPVMLYRLGQVGSLSHRYMMYQAVLLVPIAARSVFFVTEELLPAASRNRITAALGWHVGVWFVLAVAAGMMVHAIRPLHPGRGHFRLAGEYLSGVAGPDDVVMGCDGVILHYCQRKCFGMDPQQPFASNADFYRWIARHEADYCVVDRRWLESQGLGADALREPAFMPVASFAGAERPDKPVTVYRIDAAALRATIDQAASRPTQPAPDVPASGAAAPAG